MKSVYKQLRVLDLSRILVGPYASMVLSDLGAEVIKVESFTGDETRNWGPPFHGGHSTYFLSVNRSKKSICIDLKKREGTELIRSLARKSDILIENFSWGVSERLEIDYATLAELNPRLIYASVNGYGYEGPWKEQPGFDAIIQAGSGLMHITGHQQPTKVGVALCDVMAALHLTNGIQAALYQRSITGRGQHVMTSLYESTLACLVNASSAYLNAGYEMERLGNMHPSIVPYGVYQARDGQLMIAVGQDDQFRRFCQVIGLPLEERFATNKDRTTNRQELDRKINEKMKDLAVHWLLEQLREAKVPCDKIKGLAESLDNE